jgi:hypothetical protein
MTDEDESTSSGIIVRAMLKFLRDREANAAAPEEPATSIVNQVAEHPVRANPVKQTKTFEELAAMIHQDLSQIEGCPEAGVKVTVYGLNPWNCLLTFGVDAGPVRNRAELKGFCEIITERLRRLYDVSGPAHRGLGEWEIKRATAARLHCPRGWLSKMSPGPITPAGAEPFFLKKARKAAPLLQRAHIGQYNQNCRSYR